MDKQKRQESTRLAKAKEIKMKVIETAKEIWKTRCEESGSPLSQELSSLVSSITSKDTFFSCHRGQGIDCSKCERRIRSPRSKIPISRSRIPGQYLKTNIKGLPSVSLEIIDSKLTYLAEVESGILQLYGTGAVTAALSHTWACNVLELIDTVSFHFVVFDDIVYLLGKLKTKFPNIETASFECACLESLPQLNALGQIPGLKNLTIQPEGNPIVLLSLWQMYAVYRLGPTIEQINGSMVTELEKNKAENIFSGLGFDAFLSLPKYRLSSLLNSPRVKQMFMKEKSDSPNSSEKQKDYEKATELMKAIFTYSPDFEFSSPGCKITAKKTVERSIINVQEGMKKRLLFQHLWPSTYSRIVTDALEEYTDINHHIKLSMKNLLTKCKSAEKNLH